jgi:predicted transglutaminase-like cysteine proteinase
MRWRSPPRFVTVVRSFWCIGIAWAADFMMVVNVNFGLLRGKLGVVLAVVLAANAIDTLPAVAGSERHAHVFGATQPPPGWVDFCARQPSECAGPTTVPTELALSWGAWMDLVWINTWVNKTIKPLTDIEHWGMVDRWSYPDDGYGDCEDYVLLKRRMLIQSGWPREALLVTVVRNEKDEGHAVLTVTTDQGEYILDNQNKSILLWSETRYQFVKRQSQADPNVWVSLSNQQPAIATVTSR